MISILERCLLVKLFRLMVILVRNTWISLIPFLSLGAVAEIKPSVDSNADLQYKEIRKWTDVKGRTIEAAFIDIDGSNLYLEWNGKKATLPLSMFSENSLKLAKELKNLSPIVNLKYELFHGDWNKLPNWDELEANQSGFIEDGFFTISRAIREDSFGFSFTGDLEIEKSGSYEFILTSDDGSDLRINDQLVVNNDGLHGNKRVSGKIKLEAGNHTIKVGYFNKNDRGSLYVGWKGPGFKETSLSMIPYKVSIRPANKELIFDGLAEDWVLLHEAPKLVNQNNAVLQLSHDQKHLLLLVIIPNLSHQPLPAEKLQIQFFWDSNGNKNIEYPSWELGINKHGKIESHSSSEIIASFRHDLLAQKTFFECAVPLDEVPENPENLSLSVTYLDSDSSDGMSPLSFKWQNVPLRINEYTADQESAGNILDETDFKNLTAEKARHLISNIIPVVGNTASGFRAFSRSLSRADFSPLERTKAIVQFMHRHPENPGMRSLVLTLFRSRLGQMGWEKSFNVVKAVSRSAKIPRSAVYDGLRGHYWDSPKIAVKDWHAIGPFPFDEIETQGMKLPDKLSKITLRENYSINGQTLSWKKVQATEKHFSDLRQSLDSERHGKAYAVTWVNSVEAQNAALEIDSTSPSRIWINGWLIKTPIGRGNETVIQLNQGWNQILLENESVTTGKGTSDKTWQFRMSLMHPLGMGQVPGLSNFTSNSNPIAK